MAQNHLAVGQYFQSMYRKQISWQLCFISDPKTLVATNSSRQIGCDASKIPNFQNFRKPQKKGISELFR